MWSYRRRETSAPHPKGKRRASASRGSRGAADPDEPETVLGGYVGRRFSRRARRWSFLTLGFASFILGFAFALTGTIFLLQLTIPILILAVLVVWLLPETERAPEKLLERLLFAFLVALLCWPDYLAFAFPGLPWITAVRLVGVPLTFTFMICLSVSGKFRGELRQSMEAVPIIPKLVVGFAVIAAISIAFSADRTTSINKFIVAQLNGTIVFFVSCWVFGRPGRTRRLAWLLWIVVIYVSLIGIQEWRHSVVPWAGHIPSFLKIEDESVQRILAGAARAASGIYRVQSKFTTSLGLAEYYALATPFLLHFLLTARSPFVRVAAAATLPLIFWMIIRTDSRLGMVGFMLASLLFIAVWASTRWRTQRDSLFGPATLLAYPVLFCGFITATFFVGRLHAMVWGSGAQQYSTESRKLQFAMGIPKVLSHPWGYGIGRSAEVLGFTNGAGILTIDTYYLAVALEFGIVGFIVYYGMFAIAVFNGGKYYLRARSEDEKFLIPLAVSLINFLVIKSIFSQQENHPLAFCFLGALVALCARVQQSQQPGGVGPVRRRAANEAPDPGDHSPGGVPARL